MSMDYVIFLFFIACLKFCVDAALPQEVKELQFHFVTSNLAIRVKKIKNKTSYAVA